MEGCGSVEIVEETGIGELTALHAGTHGISVSSSARGIAPTHGLAPPTLSWGGRVRLPPLSPSLNFVGDVAKPSAVVRGWTVLPWPSRPAYSGREPRSMRNDAGFSAIRNKSCPGMRRNFRPATLQSSCLPWNCRHTVEESTRGQRSWRRPPGEVGRPFPPSFALMASAKCPPSFRSSLRLRSRSAAVTMGW
jgi:hypothetical protein